MADVSLVDVRKAFGPVEVIHGVSVDVPDGQFVVLVGPSGCGKSTLLRMVAGLEATTHGEIRIGGRLVNDVRPRDRDVAMVFQNYALYPHMTVAENMGFSLRMRGERRAIIEAKVRHASAILGLDPYLERLPRQLSGGQRQRVAMGRSIVRAPKVFLFDEPLSNLDAQLRVQMRAEMKDLHQRLRTTTLYVTHDQIEAMTLADTIVVLQNGRVEQVGPPLEVYDRPANLFVAGFIGSPALNVIGGEIDRGHQEMDRADLPVLRLADGSTLPLAAGMAAVAPGMRLRVGIRPEQISIGGAGIPAEVVVVEATGAETHVVLRLAGERVLAVLKDRIQVAPGSVVHLRIPPHAVHLFDPETGRRVEC